jgi:putative salt-induced outer membrane protein
MSLRRLGIAGALVASIGAAAASAQAPCPCPPAPEGPPPLWSGKAEMSYVATSGNTDTSSFGAGLEVNYKPLPWTVTLKAAYLRASTDGLLTAESFAGGVRGTRDLTPRVDVFAEALYYRNTFSGIDSRYGAEAGAGYKIVNEKTLRLRGEAAFGYTREDRVGFSALDYPTARAGLDFGWKFGKGAELTEVFSWTDNLDNSTDWYLRSTTGITADLTSVFALRASYTILYDNVPVPVPPGEKKFQKRDTITSVALVAKF